MPEEPEEEKKKEETVTESVNLHVHSIIFLYF